MWCLVHLETALPGPLCRMLKSKGLDVHIAHDVDDLLDQLWYHGSDVACIVVEGEHLPGLGDLVDAIVDWPEIPVLACGSIVVSIDPHIVSIRRHECYDLDRLAHDLAIIDRRATFSYC